MTECKHIWQQITSLSTGTLKNQNVLSRDCFYSEKECGKSGTRDCTLILLSSTKLRFRGCCSRNILRAPFICCFRNILRTPELINCDKPEQSWCTLPNSPCRIHQSLRRWTRYRIRTHCIPFQNRAHRHIPHSHSTRCHSPPGIARIHRKRTRHCIALCSPYRTTQSPTDCRKYRIRRD